MDATPTERPKSPVGGWLMIGGAMLAIIGVFLPWANRDGRSLGGMDSYSWLDGFTFYSVDAPGTFVLIGALIMLALGAATLATGRVLAVAVIGIISAGLGVLGGLIEFALVASFVDATDASIGAGVIIQPIAPLACLVGSIVVAATKPKTV